MVLAASRQLVEEQVATGQAESKEAASGTVAMQLASGQVVTAKVANGMVNMQLVNGLTVDLQVLAGRSAAAEVSPSSDAGATTVLTGSAPDLTALLDTSSRGSSTELPRIEALPGCQSALARAEPRAVVSTGDLINASAVDMPAAQLEGRAEAEAAPAGLDPAGSDDEQADAVAAAEDAARGKQRAETWVEQHAVQHAAAVELPPAPTTSGSATSSAAARAGRPEATQQGASEAHAFDPRHQWFFCVAPDACTNPILYWMGDWSGSDSYDLATARGPFKLDYGNVLYAQVGGEAARGAGACSGALLWWRAC